MRRKGLFSNYTKALKDGTKELKEYKKVVENLKTAKGNKATEAEIKALKEAQYGHLKAVAEHEQERVDTAEGFLSLYANLLLVEAWDTNKF